MLLARSCYDIQAGLSFHNGCPFISPIETGDELVLLNDISFLLLAALQLSR
jgi:hypothetical protein